MKVVHLTNNLIPGGAGKAANTISAALCAAGIESVMMRLPTDGTSARLINKIRAYADKLPLQIYRNRKRTAFSTLYAGYNWAKSDALKNADIIHLHWINDGYLSFEGIEAISRLKKKVVWTLHDSWPLTGGCNVTHGCNRWMTACGKCPQLGSSAELDVSRKIFTKKNNIYTSLNPTFVCASTWMYVRAQQSPLLQNLKIKSIPYAINIETYKPHEKLEARKRLGLPPDKKLILFGTVDIADPNKGFRFFKAAVALLKNEIDFEVLVFGNKGKIEFDLGCPTHFLGRIQDENALAYAYSAADVFVAPSVEDNFPNTVLESLSCGSPVVTFNIGGMPDMITHGTNGFLAEPFKIESLTQGILFILNGDANELRKSARQKVQNDFTFEKVSKSYIDLYRE